MTELRYSSESSVVESWSVQRAGDDEESAWTHKLTSLEDEARYYDFVALIDALRDLCAERPTTVLEPMLRFCCDVGLSSPRGEVSAVRVRRGEDGRFVISVMTAFFGIAGACSPLPLNLAEEVLQSVDDDPTLSSFLDLFGHRLMSFVVAAERRSRLLPRDPPDFDWRTEVVSLMGVEPRDRLLSDDRARRVLSRVVPIGLATRGSKIGLEIVLAEFFGEVDGPVEVSIREFCGRWVRVDSEQVAVLGAGRCVLGQDALLGDSCFDAAGAVVIVVMAARKHLSRLLPSGDWYASLRSLVDWWCVEPLEVELELRAHGAGDHEVTMEGARLGRTSWLARGAPHCGSGPAVRVPLIGADVER